MVGAKLTRSVNSGRGNQESRGDKSYKTIYAFSVLRNAFISVMEINLL